MCEALIEKNWIVIMCLRGRIDGKEMYEIRNGKMQVKAICEHYYSQNLFGSKIYVLQNLLFDKKRKKRQLILGTMQETVVFFIAPFTFQSTKFA